MQTILVLFLNFYFKQSANYELICKYVSIKLGENEETNNSSLLPKTEYVTS